MMPDEPFIPTDQLDDSLFQYPLQGAYPFCRNDKALNISIEARIKYIKPEIRSKVPQIRLASHTGLPAFLRDSLDFDLPALASEEETKRVAEEWLFRSSQTEILFGVTNPDELSQQLQFTRTSHFVQPRLKDDDTSAESAIQSTYLYYQQFWQGWPVIGGMVAVHLTRANNRVVITNSFFPLPMSRRFEQPANLEESKSTAVNQARRALANDRFIRQHYRKLEIEQWQFDKEIFIVPYEQSELAILPFDGDYYLGYQIELISPDQSLAWRVFVDSASGRILGQPHALVAHANPLYYKNAPDALAHQPTPYSDDLATLSANVAKFAEFRQYNKLIGTLAEVVATLTPPLDLEFINIGAHAYALYKYFTDPAGGGVPANTLHSYKGVNNKLQQPGLRLVAGKGGAMLEMGFNFAHSLSPKPINFQTDVNNSGLGWDSDHDGVPDKKVFAPSLDPEVIYHELTHAFLWLINRSPFEPPQGSAPFALAIAEGYANYFARSFAEKTSAAESGETVAQSQWAQAAYRATVQEGGQELGWGDDWVLARPATKASEDFLPLPDIYPDPNQSPIRQEISTYYIGMVWARALWEIRQLLDVPLTDRIALNAYAALIGWISTYEIAALAFLECASREPGAEPHLAAITAIFNRRRILAQQDTQALLSVNSANSPLVLLGVDQGMLVSSTPAGNWSQPSTPGTGGLTGITALTAETTVAVYAATEQGVYTVATNNLNNPAWQPAGNWSSPPGRIRCLHRTDDGRLIAGTHDGLYKLNHTTGAWEKHGQDSFKILGLASHGGGAQQKVFAAGIGNAWAIYYSAINQSPATWSTLLMSSGSQAVPFCLQVIGDYLYIGTSRGICWRKLDFTTPQPITCVQSLPANAMILCFYLDITTNILYAGTTNGLYAATRTNEQITGWVKIDLGAISSEPLIVTAISSTPTEVIAGTAASGLFVGPKTGAPLAAVTGVFA